jgi:hypothetical protein
MPLAARFLSRMKLKLVFLSLLAIGIGLLFALHPANDVSAQTQPPPVMPPLPRELDPPPTIYPPTQISLGSQVYYQVCMACHGDRGQGLTDEWRAALDPPDRNCWQSGCHNPRHPPGGFIFPRYVPAVVSPGMVARFTNALELHDFIQNKMPWQAPGGLTDEEYWQLTAFLVSANGINPGAGALNAANAASIRLRLEAKTPAPPVPSSGVHWAWMGLVAILGLSLLVLLVQWGRRIFLF